MHRNLLSIGRLFLAGLVFGSIGAASAQVLAGYRTLPAISHCQKLSGSIAKFQCAFESTSDFPTANLTNSEIDFYYLASQSTDTIRANNCRDSWNIVSGTCSGPVTFAINSTSQTTFAKAMYPGVSVAQGGSAYDYRYLYVAAGLASTYVDVKGIYLTNSLGD